MSGVEDTRKSFKLRLCILQPMLRANAFNHTCQSIRIMTSPWLQCGKNYEVFAHPLLPPTPRSSSPAPAAGDAAMERHSPGRPGSAAADNSLSRPSSPLQGSSSPSACAVRQNHLPAN